MDLLAYLQHPPSSVTVTPRAADRDWLELRARAPMRQPAAKANRRRPRPEQTDVAGLELFEPGLV